MSLATMLLGASCLSLCALATMAAPFNLPKDPKTAMNQLKEQLKKFNDLPGFDNDEYLRYWKEAIKNDPKIEQLRKAFQNRDNLDLEGLVDHLPQLTERLTKQSDNIRSRLEEAKRANIEDMRQLQRLQMLRDDNALKDGDWNTKLEGLREKLPPGFTHNDIQERIKKQRETLEEIDVQRKVDFKREEMATEHKRREMLKTLDERHRLQAEEEYRQRQEKLRAHGKLHHPASEQQLEDVWEQQDGLDRKQFDPRTFFHLHDKNSDRHLDAMEWENLFYNELRKVYGDDMGAIEAREDLARMREHVVKEMDRDQDGLVSLEEFLRYTNEAGFKQDDEWKSLVDEDPYTEEELEKYEEDYEEYDYDYEYDEHGNLIGIKTKQKGETKQDKTPPIVNDQGHPPSHQGNPPDNQEQPPLPDDAVNNDEKVEAPHVRVDEGVPGEDVVPARVDKPQGQGNL